MSSNLPDIAFEPFLVRFVWVLNHVLTDGTNGRITLRPLAPPEAHQDAVEHRLTEDAGTATLPHDDGRSSPPADD